jgi:hypothetical protein
MSSTGLVYLGIGLAFVLMILVSQLARMDLVQRTFQGPATTFTMPGWFVLAGLLPAVPVAIFGLAIWIQPGRLFKFLAVLVFALAVTGGAFIGSMPFLHRAVVTPDRFDLRIGTWFAPRDYSIRFADVEHADIVQDPDDRPGTGRHYVLAFDLKGPGPGPGQTVLVPIGDLVKAALRPIAAALEAHGVSLGDPDDGLDVPPDLARWLR